MALTLYAPVKIGDDCACGWRWRVKYRSKCSDEDGVYQGGACDWERDPSTEGPEAVASGASDAIQSWAWYDGCSGWLYGPKHYDCLVGLNEGGAEAELDEDNLPDWAEPPNDAKCVECCKCYRWKIDYTFRCTRKPYPPYDPCWWDQVPNSLQKVVCEKAADEEPGPYWEEDGKNGTAWGEPCGPDPDCLYPQDIGAMVALVPTGLDESDCITLCDCEQWTRQYWFKCDDAGC